MSTQLTKLNGIPQYYTIKLLPIFVSIDEYPFYKTYFVEAFHFAGSSPASKVRTAISLHDTFLRGMPQYKQEQICEISGHSWMKLANNVKAGRLSALSLGKECKESNNQVTESYGYPVPSVESVFQSNRVWSLGKNAKKEYGPFINYTNLPGMASKLGVKDEVRRAAEADYTDISRIHSYKYVYDGFVFGAPEHCPSIFYDYIYISSLFEPYNTEAYEGLLNSDYTIFTDTAGFSVNSQARSCAIFKGLQVANLLDNIKTREGFLETLRYNDQPEHHEPYLPSQASPDRIIKQQTGYYFDLNVTDMPIPHSPAEECIQKCYELTGSVDGTFGKIAKTKSKPNSVLEKGKTPDNGPLLILRGQYVQRFLSKFDYIVTCINGYNVIFITGIGNTSHDRIIFPSHLEYNNKTYIVCFKEDFASTLFTNLTPHQVDLSNLQHHDYIKNAKITYKH